MKYFLFDIGNVLVDFNAQDFLRSMAAEAGRPVQELTQLDLDMISAVETGRISDAEFVDYLNESKGLSWTVDHLVAAWSNMFSIHEIGHALFLDALAADVKVYTLSNIAQHHVDAIENNWSGFFDRVSGLFMSYEMGVRKPDSSIYRETLDRLSAQGHQCFFIDDRPENVEAAREAGIEAHVFIPENYSAIREAANAFFDLN